MLYDAVTLDASMTPAQALSRLAKHGYWADPDDPEARDWLEEYAREIREAAEADGNEELARFSASDAAEQLARPLREGRVAIRRQVGATIYWYARRIDNVLVDLTTRRTQPDLKEALGLHEYTSDPSDQASRVMAKDADEFSGVLLNGQTPVAVGDVRLTLGTTTRAPVAPKAPLAGKEVAIPAHPLLEAPRTVVVGDTFDFVIGLSQTPIAGVKLQKALALTAKQGQTTLPVDLIIISDGFDVAGGARHRLDVPVADPTSARTTVRLTALPQTKDARTTVLSVHFIVDGTVRGAASRHIVVEATAGSSVRKATIGASSQADSRGSPWQESERRAAGMVLTEAGDPPDIEVDIRKPDGNAAEGSFQCYIRNAHGFPEPALQEIDLGEDAKTFTKAAMDRIWRYNTRGIVNHLLAGLGARIASKLPAGFWTTLDSVGKKKKGPVTLQLNCEDPYVPWELALVRNPLDASRPHFLGAQVVMGRWIVGDEDVPVTPKQSLQVKAMAVLAGNYQKKQALPGAIKEAKAITDSYATMPAVSVPCNPDSVDELLSAELKKVGGVQAVHFACHGYADPKQPGDTALYFDNGEPLDPFMFRETALGFEHEPFMFLNACMVGQGGETLGSIGGFPGHCLAGRFTGLLAPLWVVDDTAAREFALAFYQSALDGSKGRSVAETVRDLRAKFDRKQPNATYLAYVFYGSPSLKLSQVTT